MESTLNTFQLEGKISLVAKEEHRISLAISKHGLKVMHITTKVSLYFHSETSHMLMYSHLLALTRNGQICMLLL